ncbi:MAG: FUSC family protein [Bryobacteraceae bacterium]
MHRVALGMGVRTIVASLASLLICHALGLEQSYIAVLTAVIVTQASVGASLKAIIDRFIGSLGGAIWGVAILFLLNRLDIHAEWVALTASIAPLAFLSAVNPSFRAAPLTAIILLFTSSSTHDPLTAALGRMLEITIGSVVALAVALAVLPARAHSTLSESADRVLKSMGDLAAIILRSGSTSHPDFQRLHDEIRKSLTQTEAAAAEAFQERNAHLTTAPDPLPFCRTLRRLRNDLTMIGRLNTDPLPDLADAVTAVLRRSGEAILGHQPAPPLEAFESALAQHTAEVADLRKSGATRPLPDETIGRIFGLTFALDQLHDNLKDLTDRLNEFR